MATVAPHIPTPRIAVAPSARARAEQRTIAATSLPSAPAVLLAFEAIDLAVGLYTRAGGLEHASRRLLALLQPEGDGPALRLELARLAEVCWGLANVRRLREGIEPLEERVLALGHGGYRVSACFVGESLLARGPHVLVAVEPPRPDPFAPDRLRSRFGLTRKQSIVARLLVDGLRNDEIARRLFISPHTARHHTEQVKLKVGAETRTAVAARILAS